MILGYDSKFTKTQKGKAMKALTIATLMLLTVKSFAADSSGNFIALSPGGSSCGQVIEEYRKDSTSYQFMKAWVNGYFSAINYKVYDGENILHGTDAESAMLWIRNYCQKNPLNALAGAAVSLYIELRDK